LPASSSFYGFRSGPINSIIELSQSIIKRILTPGMAHCLAIVLKRLSKGFALDPDGWEPGARSQESGVRMAEPAALSERPRSGNVGVGW
jgi:hypothetical protein